MNFTEEKVPDTHSPNPEKQQNNQNVEIVRIVLDFISKCLYPGIIVVLIVILSPKIEQIDLKFILSHLQSAKIGDYEITFAIAQDLAAEMAPVNGKVAELSREIDILKSDIASLQKTSGEVKISSTVLKEREDAERRYQTNSRYSVLVFHRRESRKSGKIITDTLLKEGFVSSDTETDFSELRKTEPVAGTIYITYNLAGEKVLSDVTKLIEKTGVAAEIKTDSGPTELRRGDIQLLAF